MDPKWAVYIPLQTAEGEEEKEEEFSQGHAAGSPALSAALPRGRCRARSDLWHQGPCTSRQAAHCPWSCATWQPLGKVLEETEHAWPGPLGLFWFPKKVHPGLRSDTRRQSRPCSGGESEPPRTKSCPVCNMLIRGSRLGWCSQS